MLCTKCNHDKPETEFHRRSKATAKGRQPWCKSCRRKIDREYHRKRWESGKKKAEVAVRQQRNREFIWKYLSERECVDCGEEDIIVLQFDHIRDKKHNVSDMISHTASLEALQEEIEKCDVVCANCHLRRTAHQMGWRIADTGT